MAYRTPDPETRRTGRMAARDDDRACRYSARLLHQRERDLRIILDAVAFGALTLWTYTVCELRDGVWRDLLAAPQHVHYKAATGACGEAIAALAHALGDVVASLQPEGAPTYDELERENMRLRVESYRIRRGEED